MALTSKFEPMAVQRNILERVKLDKHLRLMDLNRRSVEHRIVVEQGVLFRRFRQKLMQTEIRKEHHKTGKFRAARSADGPRLNTQAGIEDADFMSVLQRVSHASAKGASACPSGASRKSGRLSAAEISGRNLLRNLCSDIADGIDSDEDDIPAKAPTPAYRPPTAPASASTKPATPPIPTYIAVPAVRAHSTLPLGMTNTGQTPNSLRSVSQADSRGSYVSGGARHPIAAHRAKNDTKRDSFEAAINAVEQSTIKPQDNEKDVVAEIVTGDDAKATKVPKPKPPSTKPKRRAKTTTGEAKQHVQHLSPDGLRRPLVANPSEQGYRVLAKYVEAKSKLGATGLAEDVFLENASIPTLLDLHKEIVKEEAYSDRVKQFCEAVDRKAEEAKVLRQRKLTPV